MDAINSAPIDHLLRTLWERKGSDLLLGAGAALALGISFLVVR